MMLYTWPYTMPSGVLSGASSTLPPSAPGWEDAFALHATSPPSDSHRVSTSQRSPVYCTCTGCTVAYSNPDRTSLATVVINSTENTPPVRSVRQSATEPPSKLWYDPCSCTQAAKKAQKENNSGKSHALQGYSADRLERLLEPDPARACQNKRLAVELGHSSIHESSRAYLVER
eukprot:1157896-Pelagomonas_calceolata.AAC.13